MSNFTFCKWFLKSNYLGAYMSVHKVFSTSLRAWNLSWLGCSCFCRISSCSCSHLGFSSAGSCDNKLVSMGEKSSSKPFWSAKIDLCWWSALLICSWELSILATKAFWWVDIIYSWGMVCWDSSILFWLLLLAFWSISSAFLDTEVSR